MGADVYDPETISITAAAEAHVRRQLLRHSADALILGISETGCNGYMYELEWLGERVDDAAGLKRFDFSGVTICVADEHWALVRGTEIDYVTEGLNSALRFNNPNAVSECGCGESFAIK